MFFLLYIFVSSFLIKNKASVDALYTENHSSVSTDPLAIYDRFLLPVLSSNEWKKSQHWSHILNNGKLKSFPTYAEANNLLDSFIRSYPQVFTKFIAGMSVEKRPIWAYRLHKNESSQHMGETNNYKFFSKTYSKLLDRSQSIYNATDNQCLFPNKLFTIEINQEQSTNQSRLSTPEMLITAMHHAREPASLTVVLYFVGQLLEYAFSSDYDANTIKTEQPTTSPHNDIARYILNNFIIIIVPFVNPDGYVAIETYQDYLIRKNRRPTCDSANQRNSGVDLNRNYGYQFSSTHHQCDEQEYEGPEAFSEPETQAIRCLTNAYHFKTALNFHSFGGIWTRPFNCCTNQKVPLFFQTIYNELKQEIDVPEFDSAPNIKVLKYTTTGEADDWMLHDRHILAMSPEVGSESEGFWPSSNSIPDINYASFWRIISVIMKTGYELTVNIYFNTTELLDISIMNKGLTDTPNTFWMLVFDQSANDIQLSDNHIPLHLFSWSPSMHHYLTSRNKIIKLAHNATLLWKTQLSTIGARQTIKQHISLPTSFEFKPGTGLLTIPNNLIILKPFLMCFIFDTTLHPTTSCLCGTTSSPTYSSDAIQLFIVDRHHPTCTVALSQLFRQIKSNPIYLTNLPNEQHLKHSFSWVLALIPFQFFLGIIFLFIFCFIVSDDPDASPYTLSTRISIHVVLYLSALCCCFSRCRLLHQRLQDKYKLSTQYTHTPIICHEESHCQLQSI